MLKRAATLLLLSSLSFASLAAAPPAAAQSLIRDTEIEATIALLAEPIFRAAGFGPNEVQIYIVADPSLNAFVTEGRVMVFHSGLLATLKTPEQLMGVIAHESGHITGGHAIRRMDALRAAQRTSLVTALIAIGAAAAGGGGDVGMSAIAGSQTAIQRSLLRFTRGQEASADQAALVFMNAAGVDPTGMLEVLETLEREQSVFINQLNPYTLTHPLSRERINLLSQGVQRSPHVGARLPDEFYYRHGRMRAKLQGFLGRLGAATVSFGDPELDLYREAVLLHRLPAPDRAVAAVDRLIAMRPRDPYYWELKGQILMESGRGPEAVAPYREAWRLSNEDPLIAAGLGGALLTIGTPQADREALQLLERAALRDRTNVGLRRSLALAYARTGDEGMSAVVTAERLAIAGDVSGARRMAQRAQAILPRGAPGWIRAEDILTITRER